MSEQQLRWWWWWTEGYWKGKARVPAARNHHPPQQPCNARLELHEPTQLRMCSMCNCPTSAGQSLHTPHRCHKVTAVWATHRNRKYKVVTPLWPPQGSSKPPNVIAFKRMEVLQNASLSSPAASLPEDSKQAWLLAWFMGWAQPCFSKEQPFLILAKTMRTWVKELAPLWDLT